MSKQEFEVTVMHVMTRTYMIKAKSAEKAVAKASDKADRQGLETIGAFKVEGADFFK